MYAPPGWPPGTATFKYTRTAIAAVGVLALSIALGASALAASPSLGASLGPIPIRADDPNPSVAVTNRSTVAVDVALALSGDPGYTLATTSLTLAPAERTTVPFSAIGKGQATVTATVRAADPPTSGSEAVSIALSTVIRHRTWLETVTASPFWPLVPIAALLLVLVALWFVRRRLT